MTCRRFVVTVFLGLFLSFVYVNTVAAQFVPPVPPTPVPTASCIVGYQDAWYGGWAKCTSRPNDPVDVVLMMEMPGSPARQVAYLTANINRIDVGDHAFNTSDDSQVCDGVRHTISAYAIDPANGEPVLLQPSRSGANQANCGTKAAEISGTVKNILGKAITSDSWNQTQVTLLRFDDQGYAQWFNQGTVDASGRFSFNSGMNGENLLDGEVAIEIYARGYFMSRRRFTYVRNLGVPPSPMAFVLTKSPVFVEDSQSTPNIPSNGQYFMPVLRVCNLDFAVGVTDPDIHVTISGPGKTVPYTTGLPLSFSLSVPQAVGTCWVTTPIWINIDPTLPDGQFYCANFKVTESGNADNVWSQASVCAPKGIRENLGSLRPNGKG